MDRALVVVDSTDTSENLLSEAGTLAAGVDAELVVLSLLTDEELERDLEQLAAIDSVEKTGYGTATVLEAAKNGVKTTVEECLSDIGVRCEVIASLDKDRRAATIVSVADEYDCDHVFIAGKKRSPTGKAVFGDATQGVILNFDGHVTVALE
ncbi:universal stress protein [Haloprofundus salinisoli]|uniref:universal stress protein n=1 Tax=Haloprofundus salinisoli TaxID=2876193 RepID=UPI001CCDA11D|nr:universal stress protein [Haloprofundus salinisoli]